MKTTITITNQSLGIQREGEHHLEWERQPGEKDLEWEERVQWLLKNNTIMPNHGPIMSGGESKGPKEIPFGQHLTCSQCGGKCADHHIEETTEAVWCPNCSRMAQERFQRTLGTNVPDDDPEPVLMPLEPQEGFTPTRDMEALDAINEELERTCPICDGGPGTYSTCSCPKDH